MISCVLLETFLWEQPGAGCKALRWVALEGSCQEYTGQSGAVSLGSRNVAPAEEEGCVPFPSLPSLPRTHRLCMGTRIWALINRIISYEFLLSFSVGCFTRAVGLTSPR